MSFLAFGGGVVGLHLPVRRRRLEVLPRVGGRVRRQRKAHATYLLHWIARWLPNSLCTWRMHTLPRDLLPCPGA